MFGFLRKSGGYTLDQLSRVLGWIGYGSASGATVTEHTALEVSAVFCAARVIAEGIAQMPISIIREEYDTNGLKRRTILRDHWAHKLLSGRPNGWQTAHEFIEGLVFCAAIGGGGLAIKNTVRGEVRELLPVPPNAWSLEQRSDYSVVVRIHYADKTTGEFPLSQVLYLRGPSLNGFEALPAIRQAKEAIGLSMALEKQQAKLAGNGGKPSGVLSFANKLAPETVNKLRETWQERFGPNGDGGIAVLDGDAKFSPLTMTSVDAQHLETRRFQIEEVARAFRVQPIMLMQADKAATYASAEQMFRMHVIHTLGPWISRLEGVFARDLLAKEPGISADLDERNLLRGDFAAQAEYNTKALGSGGQPAWMSVNEIRAEVGLNPIADAWANEVSRGAMQPQEATNGNQAPQP